MTPALTFTCNICGEPSSDICVFCTKDACANHICEKCRRCSDCCECEVHLDEHPHPKLHAPGAHANHERPPSDPGPGITAFDNSVLPPVETTFVNPVSPPLAGSTSLNPADAPPPAPPFPPEAGRDPGTSH